MSTEAKVGSFTVLALAMLVYLIVNLGGFGFGGDEGYKIQAVFRQVDGLRQGNIVRYAGVEVGKVSKVEPDGQGVKVTLALHESVKIPVSAGFSIGSDGLMGEKFIAIFPGEDNGSYLKAGDIVTGYDQRGLDQVMVTADDVLLDIQKLVNSLNDIFGDERVKHALVDSAVNAKELTENLNRMSAVMARMAINNEQDIKAMVTNLNTMSKNMVGAAATVDQMLSDISNNGQTASDLRAAIANLNHTSQRVERMATVLEGVVTDPETADNLKATLRNARGVSEKANRMMSRVSAMSTEVNTEFLYSAGADKYMTNAEIRLNTSPKDFWLLGVNDIGEGNKTNLQFGTGNDKFKGRMGLFDNKVGVGLDAYLNQSLKLSVDAYDPNDVSVKVRAEYEFAPDTFLVGQTNDVNKSDARKTFLGLRKGF